MTTPPSFQTAGDFTGQETFNADAHRKALGQLGRMGCMLAFLGLLLFFIVAAIAGLMKIDPGRNVIIAITLVIVVALGVWQYFNLRKSYERASVTVSDWGVMVDDGRVRSTVAWPEMLTVQKIRPWGNGSTRPAFGNAVSKGTTQAVNEGTRELLSGIGIIGTGQMEIVATNTVVRVGLEHDRERCGVDPRTGEPLVGLTPGVVFPNGTPWTRTRFGEWLRHFRPDIWEMADAELDKHVRHAHADQGSNLRPRD